MRSLRGVDLFCGCGGFSTGVAAAGIDVIGAADCDAGALEVYRRNLPHVRQVVQTDLSADADAFVSSTAAHETLDVIFGSPPCQDFSNSGHHREADRAELAVTFAEAVVAHGPRMALMENVPFMLRTATFQRICDLWTGAGYSVLVLLVNAAACGVPQDRRRCFVVATTARVDEADLLTHLDGVPKTGAPTMADCLDEEHAAVYYVARNRWQPCVYDARRQSPTLRCNCLARKPKVYARRHDDFAADGHELNVGEAARIAGFPAHYFDQCSRAAAGRFIGNAVPPGLAKTVSELCVRLLCRPERTTSTPPVVLGAPKAYAGKPGRIEKLLALYDRFRFDGRRLLYTMGASPEADDAVATVLNWRPMPKWVLEVRRRATKTANADDVYFHIPGHAIEFRSRAQILRALGKDALKASTSTKQ